MYYEMEKWGRACLKNRSDIIISLDIIFSTKKSSI